MILGADLYWLFYPLGEYAFSAFRQFDLPLWNPYLFLGFPQYAEPQLSTFYPFFWAAAWLPIGAAYAALYAFHFGLAATGAYVLVRRLGGNWSGGLLAGLVLAFNGFMVGHLHAGHLPHLMTIAYLPWLLAAAHWAVYVDADQLISKKVWAATLIAGLPLGLAMLAGYAPFFPFLVAGVTLFMLWLAAVHWRRGQKALAVRIMGQLAVLGLFAGLLAAVQLLPTVEMTRHSSRLAGASYEFASQLPMPFWNLITLVMPDVYGAPLGEVFYWAAAPINAYWELAVYAGILPLFLIGLAWGIGPKSWRFWLALGLGGLLVALGPSVAVHRLFYEWIPGFGLFRVPARMGYFFVLAAAVLTGLVFDRWYDLSPDERQKWQRPLRSFLALILLLLPILIVLSILWQAAQPDPELAVQVAGVTSQLFRLLLFSTAVLLLLRYGVNQARWLFTALALVLLLVDLWGYGYKFVVASETKPEMGWIMANLALPDERTTYRVMTRGLAENAGFHYGFYHVEGYDDFRTESSYELGRLAFSDARIARLLGAPYLLHGEDYERPPVAPGWEVLTQPAGVTVYQRQDSQPRAFVVHQVIGAVDEAESLRLMADPDLDFTQTAVVRMMPDTSCLIEQTTTPAQLAITDYEPQRVVIQAITESTGWLVLSDLYYPGWQATVSGKPATIQPTNYGLRGVCLPAGSHEVVFEFAPPLVKYGLALTGPAWLVLLMAGVWLWYVGRRKSG